MPLHRGDERNDISQLLTDLEFSKDRSRELTCMCPSGLDLFEFGRDCVSQLSPDPRAGTTSRHSHELTSGMEDMDDPVARRARRSRQMQPRRRQLVPGTLEGNHRRAERRPNQSRNPASERMAGQPDLRIGEHDRHVVVQIRAEEGRVESRVRSANTENQERRKH